MPAAGKRPEGRPRAGGSGLELQKGTMITLDRRRLMTGLGALAAGIGAAKRAHAQGAQQGAQGGQDADAQCESGFHMSLNENISAELRGISLPAATARPTENVDSICESVINLMSVCAPTLT